MAGDRKPENKRPPAAVNEGRGAAKKQKINSGKAAPPPPTTRRVGTRMHGGMSAHPCRGAPFEGTLACRKEQRQLKKERKARHHKNFGLVQEVTGLWEELRRHDTSAEKRGKLVTAVLGKVRCHLSYWARRAAAQPRRFVWQECVLQVVWAGHHLGKVRRWVWRSALRGKGASGNQCWRAQCRAHAAARERVQLRCSVALLWARLEPMRRRRRPPLASSPQVKGRVAELAGSHTASRVIQACVKYGSAAGARGGCTVFVCSCACLCVGV